MRILTCLLLILFLLSTPGRAQTTAFNYQGKLAEMNVAAMGTYDFQFKLFEEAGGATQVGMPVVVNDVAVTNGIFTVSLDFGSLAFTSGSANFLEVSVRPGAGTGAYTTLLPRPEIQTSPYALLALRASGSATADALSAACNPCVSSGQIMSVDAAKVSGTVAVAANVSGVVPIANGGTGSSAQNFVDLSSNQTAIAGNKTFSGTIAVNGGGVFSGNGSGLSNINGSNIATGTI